jgi:WD40 repeat protein
VVGFWAPGLKGDSILVGAGGWLTRWHGREFQEAEPLVPVDHGVCLSADQRLLATGSWDGSVKFWDVPQRKFLRTLKLSAAGAGSPGRLWADNSRVAVWEIEERLLAIYDAASGAEISAWPALKWGAMPDPFSPDGRWCLTDGQKGTALVRNLPGGSPLGSVGRDLSYNPSFSPDGHLLAIPLEMGVVRLFELPALKERAPLRGFLRATHSVAFSPDGQRLAVGSTADESLKLWDLESGQPMITLPGEGGPCWETAFSPDGGTLLTRHELGILDIWRVPSWAEIRVAEKSEVK